MATSIITRAGHEKLKGELDHLWRVYRPEITQKVAWAALLKKEEGDECVVKIPDGEATWYVSQISYEP